MRKFPWRRRLRPYGQERVYGKGLMTWRRYPGSKIMIFNPVKNHKRERALPIPLDEEDGDDEA